MKQNKSLTLEGLEQIFNNLHNTSKAPKHILFNPKCQCKKCVDIEDELKQKTGL